MLNNNIQNIIRNAIKTEAEALSAFSDGMPDSLASAVEMIHENQSSLIIAGMGKSGHIAKKIASTFRSLGRHSIYLHPGEASHGDLGLLNADSIAIIISYSGETPELSDLITYCNEKGNKIISITKSTQSTLARSSEIVIEQGDLTEACINGLAPTTSTTLALAIGDALAVGVSYLSHKTMEDFRGYHPGGTLGAKLTTVKEIMHVGDALPIVSPNSHMSEVVVKMSEKGFGVAIVLEEGQVEGIITDGDMRRNSSQLWSSNAADIASKGEPFSISDRENVSIALGRMSEHKINCLLVLNTASELLGLVTLHDCLRAGVSR